MDETVRTLPESRAAPNWRVAGPARVAGPRLSLLALESRVPPWKTTPPVAGTALAAPIRSVPAVMVVEPL